MKNPRPYGKCRLCREERRLLKSHLLPASLYRILRSDIAGEEDTVVVTEKFALSTSRQMREYLLCPTCEDLFNKKGERWVSTNCYRGGNEFPLRDALINAVPILQGDTLRVYTAQKIPAVDVQKLIYFAASVFWRASVSSWRVPTKKVKPLDLGPVCQEQLRQFLLSIGPFPSNAALSVFVSSKPQPLLVAHPPYGGRADTYHSYRMVIPGIFFILSIGKRIPEFLRNTCIVRSSEKFIIIADSIDQRVLDDTLALFKHQYDRRMLS